MLGTILIVFLADSIMNNIHAGLHQLLIQIFGAVLVAIYVMIVTWIILFILDKFTKIKTTSKQQEEGLDKTLLNESYFNK